MTDVSVGQHVVFERPQALEPVRMHYCPGCTHGLTHRLVAQMLDEFDLVDKAVGLAPVGCAVFAYDYFACDMVEAAHGRAPAVATGIKRVRPDLFVFTYQGDGDLASIGMSETIHAAARGENITVIFINNAVYGMTGGQMAPTTLPGQRTSTTPFGRDTKLAGNPIRVSELLSALDGPAYIARVTVTKPRRIREATRAIRKAFRAQIEGLGFSLVEVLSTCPTRWGMSPGKAITWLEETMIPYYPLKEFVVAEPLRESHDA
ncbi:MAG: thiamine pyrophosphate-dependent enzyme [Armatimonadota bacterium]|jgi:2-oxoglutarate ferredoxin oxidoreductase subunit beta